MTSVEGAAPSPTVRVDKRGSLYVVTLARPEVKNAVDRRTAEQLADAFRAFDQDETASVGILAADGDVFCAGADLKAIARGDANRVAPDGDGPMGPTRMMLSKPVIAAISGFAVAGGLELALWCDLRVVEEDAKLGVLCRRFGVPLIDGGTVRLPRIVGMGHAMDLILTGRLVDAAEAKAMGLVNRVVPRGTALEAAMKLGEEIAAFPQLCMRNDRLSAYEQESLSQGDAIANELRRGVTSLAAEGTSGAQRFAGGAGRSGKPAP